VQRHRHQEFICPLNAIDAETRAAHKIVHVIVDKLRQRQTPQGAGLARSSSPCFVFHYVPKSASWLNALEGELRDEPVGLQLA
jgi:hypothetical protein